MMGILNEIYVGKTPTLLEAETIIHEIRSPKNLIRFTDLDKSKYIQKFNRLMERQFGMEVFVLRVDQADFIDAYTKNVLCNLNVALKQDLSKMVEGTREEGYRFVPKNNLFVETHITYAVLKNPEITDGEIMACILHEIGHNFSKFIHKHIRIANKQAVQMYYDSYVYYAILDCICSFGLAIPYYISDYAKQTSTYKKFKEKTTFKNPLRGLVKGLGGKISSITQYMDEVKSRKIRESSVLEYFKELDKENVKEKMRLDIDRQDEVFADKFAAIYGYGYELSNILEKLVDLSVNKSKAHDKLEQTEEGRAWNKNYDKFMMKVNDYDVHPHNIQRIEEEIRVLQYELKNHSVDPKQATVIKLQISQLKEMQKRIMTAAKDADKDEKAKAEFYKYIHNKQPVGIDAKYEEYMNKILDEYLDNI